MKISIITLFPEMFTTVLNTSILKRAQNKNKVSFELIDLRPFGEGPHQIVDDRPYGGGIGLILKADILAKAVNSIKTSDSMVILTSASGTPFVQKIARELSQKPHLVMICGHYEGIDQRFIDKYVDLELSIGDFVLTGGEIPAMAIADAVTRLLPGVLEKVGATEQESYENGLLEHPHYTRPEQFEDMKVPSVLLSGNHQQIKQWRDEQAIEKTKLIRPDLAKKISNTI